MNQDIAQIRQDYSLQSLDIQDVNENPFLQFEKWMEEALQSQVPEPTAMNLATVSEAGKPSARIVLLKGVDENGFIFFTNYQSHKGKAMEMNPDVALTFLWAELERQIRIEGKIEKTTEQESEDYFHSRPHKSQIGAWVSPQSQTVESRAWLENRFAELEKEFEGKIIPKPPYWGGYRVSPTYFEFWQGRRSRLHDRIVYEKNAETWQIKRIAP